MSNVVLLHKPVATCPQCGGQTWFIHVNGFYDDYDKIIAHECSECGHWVEIQVEIIK